MSAPRPHDLLRLTDPGTALPPDTPPWALDAVLRTPWVVVRRAVHGDSLLPIGIRGADRSRRHAGWIPAAAVQRTTPPEELASLTAPERAVPALQAFTWLAQRMAALRLQWGPTGSVGFELATGARTARPTSDLDIVIRADLRHADLLHRLRNLHTELGAAPARVDCQLDTAAGAVTLAELMTARGEVLVRTPQGPRLATVAEILG
ncbi:malonate decarboxylase holo-ACP synthase [Mycolicibacterium cosmeticum]|uniref:Phosphoribosyl-dephospho-CoA transferase n=1 Tax=Mycolicibacterium cosmeticum TaxID=258533 RepID=W9ATW9_MYCCO|nr:malonate decarboxylase holo-ACP synthase [Mycolicibacterium cosmeticum]TLH73197.1 malonate decarboxylase holo-ACP synthase [Mycolicibacterium cosmeticum]CDO08963.1 phosphoribosyl-dephospho-CoA transferase [Mycolicibacterium cosmeticum]